MFEPLTYSILGVAVASILWAVYRTRDTLHPFVFIMPTAAYIYGYTPLTSEPDVLQSYFTMQELVYVQSLNLSALIALALGGIVGSKGFHRDPKRIDLHTYLTTPAWRKHLVQMGITLGVIALGLYMYGLANVGGFIEAYDSAKGGGRASSGYLRDFTLLSIPAIVLILLGRPDARSWKLRVGILVLSSPLLVHGLLSARRGPTFMGIATLGVGWYLARNRRPSLPTILTGAAITGLLLLVLVTFRSEIYLGSSFLSGEGPGTSEVISKTLSEQSETSTGSEFMYGTYVVLQADEEEDYFWGRRYLTYLFVRPVPGFLWPTKYRDVGMESLFVNGGTLGANADPDDEVTYIEVPDGAAPGFIGDLYVEFSWGAVLATFLFGWLISFFWRRSLVRGGIWTLVHACTLVLSLYFVSQTVEAFLFRFLVILVPTLLLFRYVERNHAPWVRRRRVRSQPQ